MSSRINLNDDVADRIGFTIQGLDYDFVYPTAKEWNEFIVLSAELQEEKDKKKIKSLGEKTEKALNAMIIPVGHDTPIDDTLEKAPLPVVQAFQKQMKKWLNPED
nr:MAG TPA: hypothetical protein [Bacteriophage sp.]